MSNNEPVDLATGRHLNESAIRQHALRCAETYRAGRFKRVGQDFIDEVQADVEALVRNVKNNSSCVNPPLAPEVTFTTGALMDRVQEALNGTIGRIIQNKVQRQPSVGQTLRATR